MTEITPLKIIAAMPAYNEEKYVGTMVLKARKYTDEVIVVDDGSTDDTAEIARLAGATAIKHEKNMGYGATIQRIMAEAKMHNADVLVLLDADTQHDPSEIPAVVKPIIADGYDVVIGSREHNHKNTPFYRRIGQKVLRHSTQLLSNANLSDTECGFRAFSRRALETLELKERGMAISAETISEASRKGLNITEVPVNVTYSEDSSTLNPVAHGLQVLVRIIAMISERRPLFFFGIGGLIVILLGMIAAVRVLNLLAESGVLPIGTALVALFLLIVGVFSIFTGIILYVLALRERRLEQAIKDKEK
ncbi:MAG: glycosyltransferase [Dehalococcoidales bacterium]|nr:glycosyltransferase [Dehalococcoidales bacterium]